MGLPDLEPMQQRLLEQLEKQLASNLSYIDPEMLVKAVLPVGAQGLEQFQNLLWGLAKTATGGAKAGGKSTKKSGKET